MYLTSSLLFSFMTDRQADGDAVSKYVSVTECQYHWTMMDLAIVHFCAEQYAVWPTLTYADWMFSLFYSKWGIFYIHCMYNVYNIWEVLLLVAVAV